MFLKQPSKLLSSAQHIMQKIMLKILIVLSVNLKFSRFKLYEVGFLLIFAHTPSRTLTL